jgi:hypothetical protein
MSLSIYYTAHRESPLRPMESRRIAEILSAFSVDHRIEERMRSGMGLNWESFCVYDPSNPTEVDIIFEGATRLPDNSENASWIGVQHWCNALTEIRRLLSDAEWYVAVEDHEVVWEPSSQRFDPSQ